MYEMLSRLASAPPPVPVRCRSFKAQLCAVCFEPVHHVVVERRDAEADGAVLSRQDAVRDGGVDNLLAIEARTVDLGDGRAFRERV